MSKSDATKGPGENAELIRRISELEAELVKLRESQTPVDAPLPAREALLTEVEKIAHLGSWFLNLQNNDVKWSDELFRILGFDPLTDTASVEKFFQVLHPEDSARAVRNMEVLMQTGKMIPSDLRIVWKDGSVRETRSNGAVIRGPDGKVERVVGTLMDVTDARSAERERKHLEGQLRQAQKMEVVGRVAGGVAHDFNNLLTIISGNTDLLLEAVKDERLLRIRDAAEVGAALTRQLLAFSRQAVVQVTPLDLNTAVQDMVRIMGRLLGEEVRIHLELSTEPVVILADRGQIQQILLNLAVNARDAMVSGGELVFYTGESFGPPAVEGSQGTNKPQRWVELSVKDTGMGMDAATKERAFEPFFTTKESGKGTGLGLSTVQDIVAQAAGTIHITSQPGSGTRVTVRFPRHSEPVPEVAPIPEPTTRKGVESILLVEDNHDLRELVGAFLTSAGYQVQAVGRPSEAEALCKGAEQKFEVLIADMVMPEKSGLELAKVLVAHQPSLKTLFISGYSPNRTGLGNSVFLQKPFTRNELLLSVRLLCDGTGTTPVEAVGGKKERPKLFPFPQGIPPGAT
jgi:two-component system, cell cycle sensor histidine kinase and response regulator CckA